jgi:hypothetical protein
MARKFTVSLMACLAACSPSHEPRAAAVAMINDLPSCLSKVHWARASRTGAMMFSRDGMHSSMSFVAFDHPIPKQYHDEDLFFGVLLRSAADVFFDFSDDAFVKAYREAGSPKLPRNQVAETLGFGEPVHFNANGGWVRGQAIGWLSDEVGLCARHQRWLIVERFQPAVALNVR